MYNAGLKKNYKRSTAIILISTFTPLGNPFTATVSRAGKSPLK
jgi:hypothetical protein